MTTLRFLTAGESHGKALVGILEGMPAGLDIEVGYINAQMKRRKLGYGRGARQKMEDDAVEILSGIRHGKSIGSPICLMVTNKDWKNWVDIMQAEPYAGEARRPVEVPRPGHADLVGGLKYGHEDMRNVLERSSARETTIRVAVATLARKFLEDLGIHVASRVAGLGAAIDSIPLDIPVSALNEKVDASPVRCLGKAAEEAMIKEVESAKKDGDTLGGIIEIYASGLPVGLGSYTQWDRRIEAEIGKAFLSLNAIKGVEVGLGFAGAALRGSKVHDEFFPHPSGKYVRYESNRSGGIDGGMTTGQPIVVRAAMKPLATLMSALRSVHLKKGEPASAHVERSDVTAVPAAAVICESLLALVLAQAILDKFGGDSMEEIKPRVEAWKNSTRGA